MFCTSHYRGQVIDDKYCENLPKESLERVCNTHECPKWQYGDESAVSIRFYHFWSSKKKPVTNYNAIYKQNASLRAQNILLHFQVCFYRIILINRLLFFFFIFFLLNIYVTAFNYTHKTHTYYTLIHANTAIVQIFLLLSKFRFQFKIIWNYVHMCVYV